MAADADVQVGDGLVAVFVGAADTGEVISRFAVGVFCHGIALRIVNLGFDVRADRHIGTAVAEIPGLVAVRRAKGADLEDQHVTWLDIERGVIRGVDSRGRLVGIGLVEDSDDGKIIVHIAARIGALENLVVPARLFIRAPHLRTGGSGTVTKRPFEFIYRAASAPRARGVELTVYVYIDGDAPAVIDASYMVPFPSFRFARTPMV